MCKWLETELALIYVRSLCRWAVAANACVSFLLARCVQMVGNGACANLRSLAVPLGGCRERLCEFFVGSLCSGRLQMVGKGACAIYVRSLCR